MSKEGMPRLMTAAQIADQFQVSRRSVYRWAAAGFLPTVRIGSGRTVRFDPDAVSEALTRIGVGQVSA
jgi:excisionase family DNA binding protein